MSRVFIFAITIGEYKKRVLNFVILKILNFLKFVDELDELQYITERTSNTS